MQIKATDNKQANSTFPILTDGSQLIIKILINIKHHVVGISPIKSQL